MNDNFNKILLKLDIIRNKGNRRKGKRMPTVYGVLLGAVAAISFFFGVVVSQGIIRQQRWAITLRNAFCSLWLYVGLFGIGGAVMCIVGVTSEAVVGKQEGLVLVVLGSVLMGTSGIFATIAVKFQQQREKHELEMKQVQK